MALSPGTRLGVFEITQLIGAGGMGEVYRARDTKLGRDVAIKVLPENFADDPERLERFEREAKMLAALDHPNIGALHEFREEGGVRFLVLQLVEGESLQERIDRGSIPLREALPLFIQIAEALDAAHAKDIIHRDLKPGNIQLASDGVVKVLDFGLARPIAQPPPQSGSPTDTTLQSDPNKVTTDGSILGTPSYMSPEQAQGKPVDKRTDIWAFGCCLYEALTGQLPFRGETASATLAIILEREPDWDLLPDDVPPRIRELIESCLAKDPRYRLRDIGDAWAAFRRLVTESGRVKAEARETAPPSSRPYVISASVVLGAVIIAAALFFALRTDVRVTESSDAVVSESAREPTTVRRFPMSLSSTAPLAPLALDREDTGVALSPDGARLVYVADIAGTTQLVMRRLDQLETRTIPGTEGAYLPFFSHDGEWVGFFVDSPNAQMKKVSVEGSAPVTICDAGLAAGASWGDDDFIIFNIFETYGLLRVAAAGGEPETLTVVDPAAGEIAHWYPHVLPGAKAVLFTIFHAAGPTQMRVAVLSLDTAERRILIEGAHSSRYVPSGHIIYTQEKPGALMAVPFDIDRVALAGAAVPVTESHMPDLEIVPLQYAFSKDETLIYVPANVGATMPTWTLVWVDRQGQETPIAVPPRLYRMCNISPDGGRVALEAMDISTANMDIWIYDLERGTSTRLTFDPGLDIVPVWTPDAQRVVFSSGREGGPFALYSKAADGTGAVERLGTSENNQFAFAFSSDGKELVLSEGRDSSPPFDITVLSLDGKGVSRPLVQTEFNEGEAAVSPDGRWMAYLSGESGQDEIYVRPFPNVQAGRWQISTEGGSEPRWSRDGRELFYRNGDKMMVVSIEIESSFRAGTPETLFERQFYFEMVADVLTYDVSPDGERFLMVKQVDGTEEVPSRTELIVVQNWFEELRRVAPHPETN